MSRYHCGALCILVIQALWVSICPVYAENLLTVTVTYYEGGRYLLNDKKTCTLPINNCISAWSIEGYQYRARNALKIILDTNRSNSNQWELFIVPPSRIGETESDWIDPFSSTNVVTIQEATPVLAWKQHLDITKTTPKLRFFTKRKIIFQQSGGWNENYGQYFSPLGVLTIILTKNTE